LCKDNNIVAIQEHWLHLYEIPNIQKELALQDYCSSFKCFDDENPVPHTCRSKGQAGTALLWHKNIDQQIEILPDGGQRVITANLKTVEGNLLIMCVYMPCDGYRSSLESFRDTIAEIEEILTKYKGLQTLICGDLNSSLHRDREKKYKLDEELKKFCHANKLSLPEIYHKYPIEPTFISKSNSNSRSQIDYFLANAEEVHMVDRVRTLEIPGDTSDHRPIQAILRHTVASST
jgi:endonuclease/exonuclease/phosphatase family metal-dependent hydrolase